jgi:hypothetical protein
LRRGLGDSLGFDALEIVDRGATRAPRLPIRKFNLEENLSDEKLDKVLVSFDADVDLELMVTEANAGFTGGRVTKTQLLSWLVRYFRTQCFRDCVEKIRSAHFDELAHMKSIVKEMEQAKKMGKMDLNLQELLAPVLSKNESQFRRKKTSSKITTEDPMESKA